MITKINNPEKTAKPSLTQSFKLANIKNFLRENIVKTISGITIILSLIFLVFMVSFVVSTESPTEISYTGDDQDIFNLNDVGEVIFSSEPVELEKTDGKTNFLLLGINPDENNLTDTIIIATYYHEEKKLTLVSIPRDFAVTTLNYLGNLETYKINAVYAFAEMRETGTGPEFLAELLEDEFEINLHYWLTVNFNGVKSLINEIGGIEVNVENAFKDCQYPNDHYHIIRGSAYMRPCPSFEAGPQIMNAETALIYARSRHGTNGEAGDFARSKRQSIIIESSLKKIKEKMNAEELILNPQSIGSYLNIFRGSVRTSVGIPEILAMHETFKNIETVDGNFYKVNMSYESGFICDLTLSNSQSALAYCGGGIAGRDSSSYSRQRAINLIQDPLKYISTLD